MRLAPYLAYAKKSFLARSAYRFNHIMGIVNVLLRVFIYWEIYRTLYGGRNEVDGISLMMVATNFVLSLCMDAVFKVNDFFIPDKIRDGSIANELLRPISIQGRMAAENLGDALFELIFRFVPALLVSVLFVGIMKPAGVWMFLLFLVSAVLGYGVLWTISLVTQMLSFWLINVWSIVTIKNVFINVLSGSMIPLWFMPEWMGAFIRFTPFASIYFTPIQIYLGRLSYSEIFIQCLIQIFWIGIVYALGNFLWLKGQRKLVVQGG